jgi:YgiT-type zinc finger domain-containing protein
MVSEREVCVVCGKQTTKVRNITKTYRLDGELVAIEHVPLIVCTACGESYHTADTLTSLERLKRDHKQLAVKQTIGIVSFA